jgi:hypothetical protein
LSNLDDGITKISHIVFASRCRECQYCRSH